MRFEREHDPDPVRRKFHSISSLSELPDEYVEEMAGMYGRIREMVSEIDGNMAASGSDHSTEMDRKDDAIVRYLAFQEMQINALQEETRVFYKALETLATELEKKQDKH